MRNIQNLLTQLEPLLLFLELGMLLNQSPAIGVLLVVLGALVHHHIEPAIAHIVTFKTAKCTNLIVPEVCNDDLELCIGGVIDFSDALHDGFVIVGNPLVVELHSIGLLLGLLHHLRLGLYHLRLGLYQGIRGESIGHTGVLSTFFLQLLFLLHLGSFSCCLHLVLLLLLDEFLLFCFFS